MTLLGRSDGEGGSYLELAEFLSTRGSAEHKQQDLRQLWTRVVFNILISNTDDHLRNHGFILEPDGWRLAPAYDQNPNVEKRTHALAIDLDDPTPDVNRALETASYYGLKPEAAQRILDSVKRAIRDWTTAAKALRIPREEIERMTPAFRTLE